MIKIRLKFDRATGFRATIILMVDDHACLIRVILFSREEKILITGQGLIALTDCDIN